MERTWTPQLSTTTPLQAGEPPDCSCGPQAGPALGFPLSEGHVSLAGSAVRFSEATFAWEQDGNAAIRE